VEATVRKRLDVYKNEVSSLIEFYTKQNKLHKLAADLDPQIVLGQIIDLSRALK
jgi:adenylate kinase family enzyme